MEFMDKDSRKITEEAWLICPNLIEVRRFMKNKNNKDKFFDYMFIDSGIIVGVMGDQRTYENLIALRAVTSEDGMTADWFKMPNKTLQKISSKMINNVKGVNRVVYDITSKPPGTIEWE